MNARDPGLDRTVDTYLFATAESAPVQWLSGLLGPQGMVEALDPADDERLHRQAVLLSPSAVLVDFAPGRAGAAAELVRHLRARHGGLAVLGVGRAGDGTATLAALRAGVDDFLAMEPGAEDDARAALREKARVLLESFRDGDRF